MEGQCHICQGLWRKWEWGLLWGTEVHHKTIGLYGFGQIGQAMARRARGFSLRVLYHARRRVAEDVERELQVEFVERDTLLRQSDFISLHTPLTPETRHLISTRELELMKPTAVLVNTSRGAVVDQAALREALAAGRIFHVALDVTDPEPIPAGDPLLSLDNITVVPHIGSASFATRARMAVLAADNLIAALNGDRPPHPVNPEILERRT
jgi:glyoxylate reductase